VYRNCVLRCRAGDFGVRSGGFGVRSEVASLFVL